MTRCRVGIKNPDGTVTSMYVHSDGYPEKPGVGWELLRGYTTFDLVAPLIAVGELSGLESTLAASHHYGDARAPITHPIDVWPETGQDHEYLFVGGGTEPITIGGVVLEPPPGCWLHRTDNRSRGFGLGPPVDADWKILGGGAATRGRP